MQNFTIPHRTEISIEPLRASDLKVALQLEREAQLSVISEMQMLGQLQSPHTLLLAAFPQSDNVTSHLSSEPLTRNIIGLLSGWVVMDELEIDNLVVAEFARRQGVGRALLVEGLHVAWQRGAKNAYLEVREDNLTALSLYKSLGFTVVGRRKDYYRNPLRDALRLWLDLDKNSLDLGRIQP
jgi:[ribosomal protein S18]-alanine N-acetyltransferase